MVNTASIKSLVAQYKITEEEVLHTLKAAKILKTDETLEKVGDRKFTDEAIEGFNIVQDYFKNNVVQKGDWEEATRQFEKHQSEKAKIAKEVAVAAKDKAVAGSMVVANSDQLITELATALNRNVSEIPEDELKNWQEIIDEVAKVVGIQSHSQLLAQAIKIIQERQKGMVGGLAGLIERQLSKRPFTAQSVLEELNKLGG
jgi:hypothetical protein